MTQNFLMNLRTKITQMGYDAAYITDAANVRYLSGYTGTDAFLLICPDSLYLLTDNRFTEQAQKECADFQIISIGGVVSISKKLDELCSKHNISKLVFEKDAVSYGEYEKLRAAISEQVQFIPGENMTADIRYTKTADEIDLMRYACAATDKVFEEICGFLHPGITEKEAERQILHAILGQGCDSSFSIIVASGVNGSLPHAIPGEKLLQAGEFVTMDFGCAYRGYHADMTRTVYLGKPEDKAKNIYAMVLEAKERAEQKIKAGIACREVDAAAREYFKEQGYGEYFKHGLGHGVGLEIHESPSLNPSSEKILETGCIVTVEPGLYIPGWGGVRIEDTVLVTETGYENLFTSTCQLVCID